MDQQTNNETEQDRIILDIFPPAESLWSGAQVRTGKLRTSSGPSNLLFVWILFPIFLLFFLFCNFDIQAIEKAEANVAWMEANYEPIWSWLKQQNQVDASSCSLHDETIAELDVS